MLQTSLGIAATVLGAYGYYPYIRDILQGRTKPHAFSWLVWGTMTAIGFAAQLAEGGGAGAWVTGFTAAATLSIFLLALRSGERRITRSDWTCLGGAGAALALWAVTDDPLLSVVLITLIDALGTVPTFRKSYHRPFEETVSTYVIGGVKFVLATAALDAWNVTTVLYPMSVVLSNAAFVMMVMVRRRVLSRTVSEAVIEPAT